MAKRKEQFICVTKEDFKGGQCGQKFCEKNICGAKTK